MSTLRKIRCLMKRCRHQTRTDATGCWAECVYCGKGKKESFLERGMLQRYCNLIDAHKRRKQPGVGE